MAFRAGSSGPNTGGFPRSNSTAAFGSFNGASGSFLSLSPPSNGPGTSGGGGGGAPASGSLMLSQDRFVVPPFDVDPAIIAQATKVLLRKFDETVAAIVKNSAAAATTACDTSSVLSSRSNININNNSQPDVQLTHQHIGKIFKDIAADSRDTYARLLGVRYPHGTEGSTADRDTAHTYEFLIPYVWQQMRRTLEQGKSAGKSIAEIRKDIADTEFYWSHTAYARIQNDLLPFVVRGSKVLILGEGRLVSNTVQTILQSAPTASFYVLEGRPELPHEELANLLANTNNNNNNNNNNAASHAAAASLNANNNGTPTSSSPPTLANNNISASPSSAAFNTNTNTTSTAANIITPPLCCGQRLIEKVCKQNPSFRARMRLLPDSCAASVLGECNFVLLGAFAATKNGGIVQRVGSLQLAVLAKALGVPVYVLCETYKFSPIYPLSSNSIAQPSIPEGWWNLITKESGYSGLTPALPSFFNPPNSASKNNNNNNNNNNINNSSVNFGPTSPVKSSLKNGGSPSGLNGNGNFPLPITTSSASGSLAGFTGGSSSNSNATTAATAASILNSNASAAALLAAAANNSNNHSTGSNNGGSSSVGGRSNAYGHHALEHNSAHHQHQHEHHTHSHSHTHSHAGAEATSDPTAASSAEAAAASAAGDNISYPPYVSPSATAAIGGSGASSVTIAPSPTASALADLPAAKFLEFVPGDLITFFFTDRRILPPSGVVMDIHQTFPMVQN